MAQTLSAPDTASSAASGSVSEQHAEQLGRLLFSLRAGLTQVMEKELAQHPSGLRMSQLQVVLRLACNGPMTAGELARAIAHDPGALTRLIDQLVNKGLVQRQPHESDRRALRIALTDEGQRVYRSVHAIRMRVMELMLQDLALEERDVLMHTLQRVAHTLGQHQKHPHPQT